MPRKNDSEHLRHVAMNPYTFETSQIPEPMPFQSKGRVSSKTPMGPSLLKGIFPIFGGTSAEPKNDSSSTETSSSSTDSSKTKTNDSSSGGGESSTKKEDEITPEKFQELMSQVADLTSTNQQLQTTLNGYTAKEEEARKAGLGREEALTEDLTKAQETIDSQDQVIKSLALINAIQGNKQFQFHNPQDVIMRLDHEAYQFDVDLEGRKATVSGLDAELSRIAKEADYLLKKPTVEDQSPKVRRSTGNPPANAPTNQTGAQRREALEAKWPVIASRGRAALG